MVYSQKTSLRHFREIWYGLYRHCGFFEYNLLYYAYDRIQLLDKTGITDNVMVLEEMGNHTRNARIVMNREVVDKSLHGYYLKTVGVIFVDYIFCISINLFF